MESNNLSSKIVFWFNAARGYSIPISVMSWAVPFIFGLTDKGSLLNGILAFIGIVLVHLGANLFDDVIDYYSEKRKIAKGLASSFNVQKPKCKYIIDGKATHLQTLWVTLGLFSIASAIGLYLTYTCGWPVLAIAVATAILTLLYPVLTYYAMGEIIVGIVFAPMLYYGTYFVMTKSFSPEIMVISISTGLLTVGLLHAHTFMDYDFDVKNNKKTLSALVGSKKNAVIAQGVIMFLAYLNILVGIYLNLLHKTMLLTFLSIPTSVSLYNLLMLHIKDPNIVVTRRFWMGPMENWETFVKNNTESFMMKFLLARNVMLIFTILVCMAKIISDVIK